jgi:broad specificity phosphatase PhoE
VHALGVTGTIYHSGVGHVAEAAKVLAGVLEGARLREMPELGELDLGLWQGLEEDELEVRHRDAFRAFQRDARAVVPPEAEEVDDARERLGRALARVRKVHKKDAKLVVVVAPEFAFALLVTAAAGQEAPPDLWKARWAGDDVRSYEL